MGCSSSCASSYSCHSEQVAPKTTNNVPGFNKSHKVQRLPGHDYRSLEELRVEDEEGHPPEKVQSVTTLQDELKELENNNNKSEVNSKFFDPRNAASNDRNRQGRQGSRDTRLQNITDSEHESDEGDDYRPSFKSKRKTKRHPISQKSVLSKSSSKSSFDSAFREQMCNPPGTPENVFDDENSLHTSTNSSKWQVTVTMNPRSGSAFENSGFTHGPEEVEYFKGKKEQMVHPDTPNNSFKPRARNLQNKNAARKPPISPQKKFHQQRSTDSTGLRSSRDSSVADHDFEEVPNPPQSAALAKALAFSNTHWRSFYESKAKFSDSNSESEKANSMKYSRSVSSGFKSLTSISSAETDSDIAEDKASDSFESEEDEGYEMHSSDTCYMVPEPQDSDSETKLDTTKTCNRPKAAGRSRSRPFLEEQ